MELGFTDCMFGFFLTWIVILQENEKLHSMLSGRAGLDSIGIPSNNSHSKITLASSMDMLQSLPDSVRGCLMEAARLCAPPSVKKQKPDSLPGSAIDHQIGPLLDSSNIAGNRILAGLNLDTNSLQALQRISDGMKSGHPSSGEQLLTSNDVLHDHDHVSDKHDLFSSILSADFPESLIRGDEDFLNPSGTHFGKDLVGTSSSESEQWNIQGIENILSALAPSCY